MKNKQLTGIFPRSHNLVYITWDFEKNRITKEDLRKEVDKESKNIIDLQSNFKYKTDGLLLYQDLFRPFVENINGIKAGALTRWFDNNTFFKQPVITGNIIDTNPFLYRYIHKEANKAILPGPFAFFSNSINKTGDEDREVVCHIAEMIAREARDLEHRGISFIQFNEPFLNFRYSPKQVLKIYGIITSSISKAKTCIYPYFGNTSKILPTLLKLEVDCIGSDFISTSLDSFANIDFDKELLCGVIDSRNSLVENVQETKALVEEIKTFFNPKDVTICPSCDLEFVPKYIAEKKIKVMEEC